LDHCKELNDPIPTEPVLFTKAVSALTGPYDPIEIPIGSTQTDWEVELAVVISQRAKNIAETEAMDSIAGFTLMNDVSERDFQKNHGGQWVKGKSHDTFAPLGPWLVTPEEFGDVYSLTMNTTLNGEVMQQGSTGNMVFKVPFLISYISRFMTLLPGDVISTGTPPGVGAGKKPPRFLRAGDRLEMRIDGLGGQVHEVIQGA
jgi:2-keto-4-pentenoate hydratase/2-oxohepta-3-ene-1,7-dioic acid hydratase in catechol pathway